MFKFDKRNSMGKLIANPISQSEKRPKAKLNASDINYLRNAQANAMHIFLPVDNSPAIKHHYKTRDSGAYGAMYHYETSSPGRSLERLNESYDSSLRIDGRYKSDIQTLEEIRQQRLAERNEEIRRFEQAKKEIEEQHKFKQQLYDA